MTAFDTHRKELRSKVMSLLIDTIVVESVSRQTHDVNCTKTTRPHKIWLAASTAHSVKRPNRIRTDQGGGLFTRLPHRHLVTHHPQSASSHCHRHRHCHRGVRKHRKPSTRHVLRLTRIILFTIDMYLSLDFDGGTGGVVGWAATAPFFSAALFVAVCLDAVVVRFAVAFTSGLILGVHCRRWRVPFTTQPSSQA
ncbi:unnamed protein product [Soboliphyme baturini]|uniref:Transmembrane protein n=1 Tax=Soboliphyme baturini TaxID=241478 RepID=A0A183J378_9BILA|nr:unnamed protein product [Soboliphyme baturini]